MTDTLLIDANSVGNFCNNARPLSIGPQQVQAIYGFLRLLREKMGTLPGYKPMVLWDGASWRKSFYPDYKSGRDKSTTKQELAMQQAQQHYRSQKPFIQEALRTLGVPQIFAANMEADDLGAIMTDVMLKRSEKGRVVLLTGDKDWLQLVAPRVTWWDFANSRIVSTENFESFTGVPTPKAFIEAKALAGDAGDSVPGVGGIGMKGAVDFLTTYGSFSNFLNMVSLEKTIDITKLPNKIRALVEDESKAITFARNIALMDLRAPERPIPTGLTVDKGTPDRAAFADFCDRLLFRSIAEQIDTWTEPFFFPDTKGIRHVA